MHNYFNLRRIALFLSVIFFLSSCKEKNDGTTGAETSTNSAASTNTSAAVPAIGMQLAGTLDTLWVEAAKFQALPNARLVFSFAIAGPDTLTLYGWSCKNSGGSCTGEFNSDPDLKLEKGGSKDDVSYGPVVFWDNLILSKKEVEKIKEKIGTGDNAFSYVLFIPENKNGHIKYNIILTKKDPKDFTAISTDPDEDTGIDANPSPPKNSSN